MECNAGGKQQEQFELCRDVGCGGSDCNKICLEHDNERKDRLYNNCRLNERYCKEKSPKFNRKMRGCVEKIFGQLICNCACDPKKFIGRFG